MLTILIFGLCSGLFMGWVTWKEIREWDSVILVGVICTALGGLTGAFAANLLPYITLSCTLWTCH